MSELVTIDPPFALDGLARRIRATSNFRFDWQFYLADGFDLGSAKGVRAALGEIIATPDLHRFLRDGFVPLYAKAFSIEPVHEHCLLVDANGEVENVLAAAAGDHAGAYSRIVRSATAAERREVEEAFGGLGAYRSFTLKPGETAGCVRCRHYANHLFSEWFYGVAWDWCLFAAWPAIDVMWMGCLTDTD
jgi:hypothetical protein